MPDILFVLQAVVNGLADGSGYVLMALGLTLIFGVLRVVNFAHGEFFMLGAFAAYYVSQELRLPYLVSVFAAMLALAIGAALTYWFVFRPMLRERDYFARLTSYEFSVLLASLGLSILLLNGTLAVLGGQPRLLDSPFVNVPLHLGDISIDQQRLVIIAATTVLVILTNALLQGSRFGKMVRAVSQNREAAALVGIDLRQIYLGTMALAGILAGAAGALVAPIGGSIYPTIGSTVLLKAFVVVIVGGLGSIWGAVIAGLLLGIVEAVGATFMPLTLKDAIGFVAVIAVLIVRPNGLFSFQR